MGPIYSYLIAWIAGGVLLASGLLLERAAKLREPASSPEAAVSAADPAVEAAARAPLQRPWFSLLWMGLLAYGGVGVALEAFATLEAPLRPLCAGGGGLTVFALGWLLLLRDA